MVNPDVALASLAVDSLVGDPPTWPHPVRLMGSWIAWVDGWSNQAPFQKLNGLGLALLTPVLFGGAAWAIIWTGHRVWHPLGWALAIGMGATTVAWKSLIEAGQSVRRALDEGLPSARQAVSMIVGRDTAHLDQPEVVRAAVETLAENIVDGFISPLFYGALGGAPLMVAYRAVNTLDSMVGYKNERYRDFGWASARLDDVLNWVPARITGGLMLIATAILGLSPRRAATLWRRDAKKHPSPNGGIPESLMAGALDVQLGGVNTYQGQPSDRARLGDPHRPLVPEDIPRALRVVRTTGILAGLVLVILGVILR